MFSLSSTSANLTSIGGSPASGPPPFVVPENQQPRSHSLPQQVEGKKLGTALRVYARRNRAKTRNVLQWNNRDVAERVSQTLKATYDGDKYVAEQAADDANSSARAAKNWIAGENPMSLTAFLNAWHNNPTFKAWARKILLMEQDLDPQFQAELSSFIRAAQRLGGAE